ncbi:MAG TPA: thioredoxin domain-containing protein [Myxococcales bacterium]|jgi:thiol-disulfide isomerase/thioredoxin
MARPPLFQDLGLEAAHAQAKGSGKVVLLDVFGEHCPPCRQMDQTTWRAPEVEGWVKEHAVAIQLDQTDAAVEPLGVMAVPTMIVFRDGKELDRSVGGRGAPDLVAWLDGVLAGKTELDALRAVDTKDVEGRLRLASALVMRSRLDEALQEYLWLWEHAVEVAPEWVGVKYSFLLQELEMLVDQHAPAREAFARLRDEAATKQGKEEGALSDFLALNAVLGDQDRTLAWWDSVKASPPEGLDRSSELVELLEEQERWEDLGRLIRDPVGELRREGEIVARSLEHEPSGMPAELLEQLRSFMTQRLRYRAVVLCKSMRAVGRVADAEAVAGEARKLDASKEMEEALASKEAMG